METIIIKTQKELDALPDKFDVYTRIEIRAGVKIYLSKKYENSSVEAWENSRVVAWGNSSVVAWENSRVVAWENSRVVARGNSSVVAWGNSSVVARENSSVVARENSRVEAWENSRVEAWENSSVVARENSSVEAWGNSRVVAWGNSSVVAWGNSSVVARGNSSVVAWGNSSVDLFLCAFLVVMSARVQIKKALDNARIVYKAKNGNRPEQLDDSVTIVEYENLITPTFDQWLERGYVVADGITKKLVSKKSLGQVTIYEVSDSFGKQKSFVAQNGDKFAHGKTSEEAISDLRFKISDRDTSKYERWTLETSASQEEMIEAYRKITGACEEGVKMFLEEKGQIGEVDRNYSVKEVIELSRGRYKNLEFEKFFKVED